MPSLNHSKRTRLVAAIEGSRPDRVPRSFWQHAPEQDADVDTFVRATIDAFERYDLDFVKITPRMPGPILAWGIELGAYHPHRGFYFVSKRGVSEPDDWRTLAQVAPDDRAQAPQLEALRKIRSALGPDVPILMTLFSPVMAATFVADDATFARHLRDAPDAVAAGLRTIAAATVDFAHASLASGADGFLYGIKHASARAIAWDTYAPLDRDFDRPVARELFERSHVTIAHLHGPELAFDRYLDFPAHALNWYDRVDGPALDRIRARAPQLVLAGGVDHERTLMIGTPAEVRAEVLDAVAQTEGRGFILAPGCTAPITVPEENIRAMLAAIEETTR
jgi:uroporphyrinogen decarboxylase